MQLKVTLSATIEVPDEYVDGLSETDIFEYFYNAGRCELVSLEREGDDFGYEFF